ncbi:hypothetical protein [Pseudomonas sp. CAM1A]|uniref:hypothetical protein n=1 Tax=Pseudomonas sp. CAM1A TaxID=3231717 RepID=UPI0039C72F30
MDKELQTHTPASTPPPVSDISAGRSIPVVPGCSGPSMDHAAEQAIDLMAAPRQSAGFEQGDGLLDDLVKGRILGWGWEKGVGGTRSFACGSREWFYDDNSFN